MKLASFLKSRRTRKAARPMLVTDPLAHFSLRELADLPSWHPAEATDRR